MGRKSKFVIEAERAEREAKEARFDAFEKSIKEKLKQNEKSTLFTRIEVMKKDIELCQFNVRAIENELFERD